MSTIWFLYDFSAYAFGIYSSYIINSITGSGGVDERGLPKQDTPLFSVFAWNALILILNLPGSLLGAFGSDWLGCQNALCLGVMLQALVGFLMAFFFSTLKQNVAAFTAVYGLFLSLGEFGPGDNCGLLAAKSCATAIRGRYYGIASAVGKIGAFVGSWAFPLIVRRFEGRGKGGDAGMQAPFYIASGLCIISGLLAVFGMRRMGQDVVEEEDVRFRKYLEEKGYDLANFGIKKEGGKSESGRGV